MVLLVLAQGILSQTQILVNWRSFVVIRSQVSLVAIRLHDWRADGLLELKKELNCDLP